MDECSTKQRSSNSPTKNGSASAFLRTPSTLKTTHWEDHPLLGNTTFLTPNKGEAEATMISDQILGQVTSSRDFSALSAADFGITPESFTPQQKGNSKSLIKKFRRRSAIGARGSPENNSLIQYIACQKRKGMENPSMQASPFKHHNVLLREKIAAFQSSFKPLEETEETPNQTNNTRTQSQCIVEEFSRSAASQQSCKKVRFAEKESVEVFNQSKLSVTPLPKGQLPSSVHHGACLRSVLKKCPELVDDSNSREGSEASASFETRGPLQIESNTRPVSEMEEDCKDRGADVPAILPLHREAGQCSPSESRKYSTVTPIKQSLPQPNFDDEDALPPATPTTISTIEHAVNSDMEETNRSPDFQATSCRITRSSWKRKLVTATETDVHLSVEKQPKRAPTKKVPKPKVGKAHSKKTPASKHKGFGKRRKKKQQKTLYGPRETVSKKPLLSPIPEMKEDLSCVSYQSTPSQISILDFSDSNDACIEYMDKTPRQENCALQNSIVDSSGLNLSLDLEKEDALPGIQSVSSQLQDAIMSAGEIPFPWDPPGKISPAKLKSISTNQQVQESECSSNETKTQKELEFLSGTLTGNVGKGELDLAGFSASELTSEKEVSVNFKRFPRRSRRLSHCLPNTDGDQSETTGNVTCIPRHPLEELLPTPQSVNNSVTLRNLQDSIEESFTCVPNNNKKRVRRSMRRLKDAENSGLAWINLPADNTTRHAILDSSSKRQNLPSSLEKLEYLCQKQDNLQVLLPVKEEQENAPVVMSPCRTKVRRRKSICALRREENPDAIFSPQRNRRASLGYRSDQCYRKDSEIRKLLVNQATILI